MSSSPDPHSSGLPPGIAPPLTIGTAGHIDHGKTLLIEKLTGMRADRPYERERGMTIVPVRLYWKGSRVKVEIALARGKKHHDKRESIKSRDAKREMDRHSRRG